MNMINRKQLCINQTSTIWKKLNKMRHFTVIADLIVAQKKILRCYLFFSIHFISVYVSFIMFKNCFLMGFVILVIYFRLKTTIFNVKT